MSVINYRRSVNGQNDQLGRKFLSDSITPWWGVWNGITSIDYTNLPPAPGVLAKLVKSFGGGYASVNFTFNAAQNLNGYQLEFWHRCALNPTGNKYIYIGRASGPSYYKQFATTGGWILYSYPVPDYSWTSNPTSVSKTNVSNNVSTIVWDYSIAGAWTFELAGVNFRRL
jgi:hypothetical protein